MIQAIKNEYPGHQFLVFNYSDIVLNLKHQHIHHNFIEVREDAETCSYINKYSVD